MFKMHITTINNVRNSKPDCPKQQAVANKISAQKPKYDLRQSKATRFFQRVVTSVDLGQAVKNKSKEYILNKVTICYYLV